MKAFEKVKKNLLDRFPSELRTTIFVCVTISLFPLMIILFLRDFLPHLATHRIMNLTYGDVIFFIAYTSVLSSVSLILCFVLMHIPAKPVFYSNGRNTPASKRIKEYANEVTAYKFSIDNLSEKKKRFLLNQFPFCFPALSCIFAVIVLLITLNIVFRLYILTILITGVFLVVSGFVIRKSKRGFPVTAKGFDSSNGNKRKKLNLFTSNVWILCGAFLINGIFLKGYIFLACAIIVSGVVPFLYSYSIKN